MSLYHNIYKSGVAENLYYSLLPHDLCICLSGDEQDGGERNHCQGEKETQRHTTISMNRDTSPQNPQAF